MIAEMRATERYIDIYQTAKAIYFKIILNANLIKFLK